MACSPTGNVSQGVFLREGTWTGGRSTLFTLPHPCPIVCHQVMLDNCFLIFSILISRSFIMSGEETQKGHNYFVVGKMMRGVVVSLLMLRMGPVMQGGGARHMQSLWAVPWESVKERSRPFSLPKTPLDQRGHKTISEQTGFISGSVNLVLSSTWEKGLKGSLHWGKHVA